MLRMENISLFLPLSFLLASLSSLSPTPVPYVTQFLTLEQNGSRSEHSPFLSSPHSPLLLLTPGPPAQSHSAAGLKQHSTETGYPPKNSKRTCKGIPSVLTTFPYFMVGNYHLLLSQPPGWEVQPWPFDEVKVRVRRPL